jgi:cleavage and polyadenylation specificity factor subunit 2
MLDVAFNSSVYKVFYIFSIFSYFLQLKLKDTVLDTLQMHKVGDYNIAWINGALALPERLNETDQPIPALNEAAEHEIPGHRAVFIGEVRLADFKQVLAQSGYRSEFIGGVLVTAEGTIALKKEEVEGLPRIKIEGVISADYFKIRQLLYSQYTIL